MNSRRSRWGGAKPRAGAFPHGSGRRRPHPSAEGFHLIELQVVAAIALILAGLLAPTVLNGGRHARTTRCLSNLRQFAIAAGLYIEDNRGSFFPFRRESTGAGTDYWFGRLGPGPEGSRTFDPATGVLHPYLGNLTAVSVCPEMQQSHRCLKPKGCALVCTYGYNLHLAHPDPAPGTPSSTASATPLRLAALQRPLEIVVFADSAQVNTFQAPASPSNPMIEEFYYVNSREPTVHFRHRSNARATFADGHVAAASAAPGSLDERMPNERIGRLPNGAVVP